MMKPIEIRIVVRTQMASQAICAQILDTERWPEFKGYAFLPGIASARFETRTPAVIGSRIRVRNTDGSSHIEEVVEWDTASRIALRFQDFDSPLRHFATHFLEAWEFRATADGAEVTRTMTLYPKNALGRLMLVPISKLMKKALEKHLAETTRHPRRA
jgi:hypothetical protein